MQVVSLMACIFMFGCSHGSDDVDEPATPKAVSFEGQVEPTLVGNWATASGKSTFDLQKDGSAIIVSVSATPGGDVKSTLKGSWLVSGSNLRLKYTREGQSETVVQYPFVVSGDHLTLQSHGKLKTEYQRK